ncbi:MULTISPECIES: DEAD/DEAH box helicase [unclassified Cryobacterium]|uniref:DEAD/DEAH box helicase n=1 Tax=unclassified Cryobacterium TaxID=2649013 RepID=UPI00106A15FB|nr:MULTISPECIES: DEAD/DEAH box helicase [unclassified Cryobacterium]TFC53752.1 helicase [Cryobacterium sp. TMB3-1-2]TFC75171.1 helicase [Cryobacterium sp. TMB3-15]TFC75307.1 helicase [Cryobacterium sp. TMB3-10]TFD41584.1 helicase [Cryobacterium sp. TMB3-12]
MAHNLSDLQIARLVGPQAYSRGVRYAKEGRVEDQVWQLGGSRLLGTVGGTQARPYDVTVTFQQDSNGTVVRASGTCSCPMGLNCKHVVALLLASRSTAADLARARSADSQRPHTSAPATWQSALAPLTRAPEAEPPTGTALALQFELLPPPRAARLPAPSVSLARLGVRPMVRGKKGKWIRGNLTWDNLSYSRGMLNRAQLRVLSAIFELYSSGQRYHVTTDPWLHLDGFANRALWGLLGEAREAGIPFIGTTPGQEPVTVSDEPAELSLDIRRDHGGLTLSPTVSLGGQLLDRSALGYIGDPAHGLFTWTTTSTDVRLTIAPLARQLGRDLRVLASAHTPITIPPDEENVFLADFYPFLRGQLSLISTDESFELPDTARPVLALSIIAHADARIGLHWEWQYTGGAGASGAPAIAPLHGPATDDAPAGYRDTADEARILHAVSGIFAGFPAHQPALFAAELTGSAGAADSAGILRADATLDGARMIEFLEAVLPVLEATDDLLVQFVGDAPEYREAAEPPTLTFATSARAESRDWFDLSVRVTVDGEDVPFDEVFRALATGQELMILPDGTYFSLDRPELQQLRHLIEEARGLQDSPNDSLRINRAQSDLWEELQDLGSAEAEAAAWRDTLAGLADGATIAHRELPAAVQASLRPYQQTGFDWLGFLYDTGLGGVLADDMGLGKTLQAIALIVDARERQSARRPFLVVAPTSVVHNWATECARFAPGLSVAAITETTAKRGASLAEAVTTADVVITSYTLFRLDFDEYDAVSWAGLLLDEAQFVKNHKSRAHQCAKRLQAPFKLAITGTPLENNLMELWSLLSITAPGLFPSAARFSDYYQRPIETQADGDRLGQLRRRIRPFMLRRTKDQVASDLPAKQEQVLELELHPRHRRVYQMHLQRERQKVLGLLGDLNQNRFEIFRSITMLRQLSLDASLYDDKYADIPSSKLDVLMELLEDVVAEGHRTLIFSQFTGYLAKVRTRLDAAGVTYSYLDGRTRNRAAAIDGFKNGDTSVFLISLKAGGFGLNLTEADYCILLDPWWNPAAEAQAVDRAHRIGQTKNVMVYRLVATDTIEEKVMALKAVKAKLFDSVMTDGGAQGTGQGLTASDIRELLE